MKREQFNEMLQWHLVFCLDMVSQIKSFFFGFFATKLDCLAEIRKFLRQENGLCIPKMVSLLSPDFDSLSNEYAALWLRNVSEDYSTKSMIMSTEGAIPSLVALLSSNDPDIAFNSLGALDKIMADYQPRQTVREVKGHEPLFNLIKSEYPQIQELAFS